MAEDKYVSQKKYLSTKKRMSVWVDPDKYEHFKERAKTNGTSVYALINKYIDEYITD